MPQDAYNLSRIALELDESLRGGKINRIIQPDKDEVSFNIYTGKTVLKLILNTNASNARVCISQTEKEPPLVAPNFCMLLRKHLLGGEILSVKQIDYERIIALTVHCVSDFTSKDRILYAEIMGKYSNLILVEDGTILGALKTTALEDNAHRILFSGAKYSLPAPQDKVSPLDKEGVRAILENSVGDPAEYLFRNVSGISAFTANEIVNTCPNGIPLCEYIYTYLFGEKTSPCVIYRDGAPFDFYPRPLPGGKIFPSLNSAQDEYFTYKETKKEFEGKKTKLRTVVSNLIKKQKKNLSGIYDRQAECADMETNRLKGELITSYIYTLRQGMEKCELVNYYDEKGGIISIALDKTLTPSQNAQKYFKKYNKQKRTLAALEPQLKKQLEELEYSSSVLSFISAAENVSDLKETEEELAALGLVKQQIQKKKKDAPVPFREYTVDGFTVLSGRNNLSNNRLLKSLAPDDIWLHTQKYHSSHVGILSNGKPVPDSVIEKAAKICAYYSEAREGNKVPVDYCERRFVKKPPATNAGFVTYTDYKTILVDPSVDV